MGFDASEHTIITDTATLAAFCERLSSASFITVDTEFMRESTFWAQLCLIQMAGPHEAAIIDPLVPGIDLAPFFALMANEAVTKVFHAARQDIEIFVKQAGAVPHPLFDTQVAAMVCGYGDQVSYDQLVYRVTGEAARQDLALHRLVAPAALAQADRLCHRRRHLSPRRLRVAEQRARRAGPHDLGRRGDGGALRHRDLPHAPRRRLAAAEDAREEAAPARHHAGARRLARARGAGARRAARPRAEGRGDLRDRPAAAARRRGARAAPDHPARLRALQPRARHPGERWIRRWRCPTISCRTFRASVPRPSMRAPRRSS